MFFVRGFKFVEFFRVWHTHSSLVLNSVMTTNNIDMPSSLKREIQLAIVTVVVAKTTTTVVATITIMGTSTILAAKTNKSYFTSPIWSLCKLPHVFV